MTPLVDYFQTPPWSRHAVGIAAVAGISMLACRLLLSIIFEPARLKDAKESLDSVHSNTSEAPETGFSFDATKNQDAVQKRLDAGKVTVSRIMVYPIKSCRGISVLKSNFTPLGLEYDRQWCIIDAMSHRIFTARAVPKMVLITPQVIESDADPCGGRLQISFPAESGCETFFVPLKPTSDILQNYSITDDCSVHSDTGIDGYITQPHPESSNTDPLLCSTTLSKYFGKPVHLIFKGPRARPVEPTWSFPDLNARLNYQDGYPLMVVSEESFGSVKKMASQWCSEQDKDEFKRWNVDSLVLERYRPNVVFNGASVPFSEDMWREIVLTSHSNESSSFTLVAKCTRCLLPNIDPSDGVRNMSIPSKPLSKFRTGLDPGRTDDSCFGCNAVGLTSGVMSVGDVVSVTTWDIV